MRCPHCGSSGRIHVHATISAPGELNANFTKRNLRRGDVHLVCVNWETTDFLCSNLKCQRPTLGFGNYVSNLAKENQRLKELLEKKR